MKKTYAVVSAILFGLVALLHLARALTGWDVFIGDYMLPVARSWIVFGVTLCFAAWGIRGGRTYVLVSSILFGLVALLHLYRVLVTQTVVTVDTLLVPLSASWVGAAVSVVLCIWGFRSYATRNN